MANFAPRPLVLGAFTAIAASACSTYQASRLPEAQYTAQPRLLREYEQHQAADSRSPDVANLRIDLSHGLNPDEAARVAVLLNPDLIALRDAHGEGQAEVLIAGVLPNPVLGATFDHPYGAGSAGTDNVVNLSLGIDVKPFIARSARRNGAAAAVAQIDLGIAWQEWQVAQQARLLVVRLGWVRKRLNYAHEELDFAEQTAKVLSEESRARDATLEQVGVQRAALEGVRRAQNQLEQEEVDSESTLRTLLGNPKVETLEVIEPTMAIGRDARTTNIDACVEGRLDLAALRRGYQAGEERLRASVLDQFPALTIGVEHLHNEAALNFIGAFVNVELPVFNRNQGQVKLGEATRRRLAHEYDARVAGARSDLDRLLRLSAVLSRELPGIVQSIAPLEEIELKEREAVSRGDISRLWYQTVRSALFDQRLQEAALSQGLAEARIGLETACGAEPGRAP